VKLVRGAWKILVGIKDGLVLIAMLLFFGLLFAALNARPNPAAIHDGALDIALNGTIVEQPKEVSPLALAQSGGDAPREYRLRDVVRAIDAAKDDKRVKVVVLDLDHFGGGYPEAISEVADALGRVRASGKPVLAYATAYTDSGYRLASEASEIWMNPMGGTLFLGPGGSQLYYKGLIDKLAVDVHVYRVGKFKSYVEPYTRADSSPEAKQADQQLYGAIFDQWREGVMKARPKAQIAAFLTQPDKPILAAGGDIAKANLAAGIVDKLGDRTAFGQRVAQIAGVDSKQPAGAFNSIDLDDYIAANPLPTNGDAIGVVTVAGDIVDGKGGPGEAAGDTISNTVLKALAKKDLKALVVRVDSPGGSAFASEQIRSAIMQAKAQKLPVIVSMGSLAASGGYWVSTSGDEIFAEPNTITGSIGIFGIIPTFENTLKKIGVTSDGIKTTPLSGQPDVIAGTNPTTDAIFQAGIDNGYREFVGRVAQARHMTPDQVNAIAQGHVWDGGTAHQIGLVDHFGTLKDAIAEAARRAGLDPAKVHAQYLEKKPSWVDQLALQYAHNDNDDDDDSAQGDIFTRLAAQRRAGFAQALGEMTRLTSGAAIQARCLECAGMGPAMPSARDVSLMHLLLAKLAL
jgi:protease-4